MTPDQQKQYDDLFNMFSTDGWKSLIENLEETEKAYTQNSRLECTTNEQWQYRRGQLEVLNYLLNYEQSIEFMYEQAQEVSQEG